jgi:hypothetical protein
VADAGETREVDGRRAEVPGGGFAAAGVVVADEHERHRAVV